MKYTYSEIFRFGNYSWNRRNNNVGKYGCQIFGKNNEYVGILIGNTFEEVKELLKQHKKENEYV